jgi:hypothetical protein
MFLNISDLKSAWNHFVARGGGVRDMEGTISSFRAYNRLRLIPLIVTPFETIISNGYQWNCPDRRVRRAADRALPDEPYQ